MTAVDTPAIFEIAGSTTEGTVALERYSGSRRIGNAAKIGGGMFVAGVAILIIPVVHFICPLLFIAAPLAALWQFSIRGKVYRGSGPCPGCSEPVYVTAGRKLESRFSEFCPACKRMIEVSIEPSATASNNEVHGAAEPQPSGREPTIV